LPRKGSKDFNEKPALMSGYADKWELANQAKKDARSTCETYFKRVAKYAFPPEKKERAKNHSPRKSPPLSRKAGKSRSAILT
jgi:hypothetical protein